MNIMQGALPANTTTDPDLSSDVSAVINPVQPTRVSPTLTPKEPTTKSNKATKHKADSSAGTPAVAAAKPAKGGGNGVAIPKTKTAQVDAPDKMLGTPAPDDNKLAKAKQNGREWYDKKAKPDQLVTDVQLHERVLCCTASLVDPVAAWMVSEKMLEDAGTAEGRKCYKVIKHVPEKDFVDPTVDDSGAVQQQSVETETAASASDTTSDEIVFPLQAIVGSLGDAARIRSQGCEIPVEFLFGAMLTMLSVVCSGKLRIKGLGLDHDTRLYTVLYGESGDAKKSAARNVSENFLKSLKLEGMPLVLSGVGSAEGLCQAFGDNSRVVLSYDEMRSFLDKTKIQASVLLPAVTELYEKRMYHNYTKDTKLSIDDARLGFLGCATTGTYEHMWTQEAIDIGFPNRLFVIGAKRKPKVMFPLARDGKKLREICDRVKQQVKRLPLDLELTADAKNEMVDWYGKLPSAKEAKRLDTIGRSLLLLIAFITDKNVIDLETARIVRLILDYEFRLRQLIDPIDADGPVAKLEEKIRRVLRAAQGRHVPPSELKRSVNYTRHGIDKFNRAIQNLMTAGEVALHGKKGYYLKDSASALHQSSDAA
jgi:hypothetical protein